MEFTHFLWNPRAAGPHSLPAWFCFLIQMFGCGSVAQVVLSRGTHGGFLTINLAFGFAVTLGILVAGQVSGKDLLSPFILDPQMAFPQGTQLGKGVVEDIPKDKA